MINTIIFWLEKHPRSIAGTVKYLSYKYKVICICREESVDSNRKRMGWENENLGNTEIIYLSRETNIQNKIESILKAYHDEQTFHFMMGFKNKGINHWVYKYIIGKNPNLAIIAERPTGYNLGLFKTIYSYLFYRISALRLGHNIKFILAMGTLGVKAYTKAGFRKNQVLAYMYHKITNLISHTNENSKTDQLRILYVGQFDKRKGSGIMMSAFDGIKNYSDWTLDLVGANGDMEKETIEWAKNAKNVNYIGVWPSIEVSDKTSQYDLCLVPSLYDGWGMFVTESIESGVGCITTTKTGSRDLVEASQAGLVIESGSIEELQNALIMAINNREMIERWKENARLYRDRISDESIGNYVIDCINYFTSQSSEFPKCPWL